MPSHTCSVCKRTDFYPSKVAYLHKCQVCHRPFCKQCAATYFLCSRCSADLPAGVVDNLVAAMSQPKKTMEATKGTTTIGAILVPTTALTTLIVTLTHAYFLYFLCVLQAVLGVILLIVSAVTRYNSREAMRATASSVLRPYDKGFIGGAYLNQANPWQQQPQYNQPMRPIEPPAVSPAVPSSAFVPVVNEIPYAPPAAPRKTRVVPPSIDTQAAAAPGRGASGGAKGFCGMCGAEMPNISDLKFCPGCGAPRE